MKMYTKEQNKMADTLLGVIRRGIIVESTDLYKEMRKIYNIDAKDDTFNKKVYALWIHMERLGLIDSNNFRLSLTLTGMYVADLHGGIAAYIASYKVDKETDDKMKQTTIWNNKVSIVVGVTSLGSILLGFLLGRLI